MELQRGLSVREEAGETRRSTPAWGGFCVLYIDFQVVEDGIRVDDLARIPVQIGRSTGVFMVAMVSLFFFVRSP